MPQEHPTGHRAWGPLASWAARWVQVLLRTPATELRPVGPRWPCERIPTCEAGVADR